jgi:hypothetical protein
MLWRSNSSCYKGLISCYKGFISFYEGLTLFYAILSSCYKDFISCCEGLTVRAIKVSLCIMQVSVRAIKVLFRATKVSVRAMKVSVRAMNVSVHRHVMLSSHVVRAMQVNVTSQRLVATKHRQKIPKNGTTTTVTWPEDDDTSDTSLVSQWWVTMTALVLHLSAVLLSPYCLPQFQQLGAPVTRWTACAHFHLSHFSPSYIFNGRAAEVLILWNTSWPVIAGKTARYSLSQTRRITAAEVLGEHRVLGTQAFSTSTLCGWIKVLCVRNVQRH